MPKYEQRAVDALHAVFTAGFATQLRAVETDEGLSSGALTDPQAYIRAFVPSDNRTPLIQIYAEGGEPLGDSGNRQNLSMIDCTVVATYGATSDMEAAERFMGRYLTAMIQLVRANPRLGNAAGIIGAWWTDFARTFPIIDQAATRHARGIGVMVHVQD